MPAPDSKFIVDVFQSCDAAQRAIENYTRTFALFHALLDKGDFVTADSVRHATLGHLDSYCDAMLAARRRIDAG